MTELSKSVEKPKMYTITLLQCHHNKTPINSAYIILYQDLKMLDSVLVCFVYLWCTNSHNFRGFQFFKLN